MKIEPGEVRVAHVAVVVDRPATTVWHVDLDSKYAEVVAYSNSEVLLCAGDRTLGIDEKLKGQPTALVMNLPDDWLVMVECARYTCRIVGYKPREVRG